MAYLGFTLRCCALASMQLDLLVTHQLLIRQHAVLQTQAGDTHLPDAEEGVTLPATAQACCLHCCNQ